jgi:hypothetical protein
MEAAIKNIMSLMATNNLVVNQLMVCEAVVDVLPSSLIGSNVSLKWKHQKSKELGTFPGSQHFGGRGAWWSFGMGTRKNDKHQLFTQTKQTKQQVD